SDRLAASREPQTGVHMAPGWLRVLLPQTPVATRTRSTPTRCAVIPCSNWSAAAIRTRSRSGPPPDPPALGECRRPPLVLPRGPRTPRDLPAGTRTGGGRDPHPAAA